MSLHLHSQGEQRLFLRKIEQYITAQHGARQQPSFITFHPPSQLFICLRLAPPLDTSTLDFPFTSTGYTSST